MAGDKDGNELGRQQVSAGGDAYVAGRDLRINNYIYGNADRADNDGPPLMAKPNTTDSAERGHAFISYVREDSGEVDALQRTLEASGIPVWRDTASLWPGEDWRAKIRDAITRDALVFIACFSSRSAVRRKSYQNEEILLAVDQLRLRQPGDPWLIPVRFDDCDVPDLELGAGRTLASIQRAGLFGASRSLAAQRLVQAVQRLLPQPAARDANVPSRLSRTLAGHTSWTAGLAFSPDGRLLASTSDDKTVRIWDVETWTPVRTLREHESSIRGVAFSPDGTLLASASDDSTVRVWETASWASSRTLAGHVGPALAAAFSPDGTLLASSGYDHTIRLWSMPDGIPARTLRGHTSGAWAVAFSPDGSLLASAADDSAVRVWETPTGKPLHVLTGQTGVSRGVAFTPDGALLASSAEDGIIRLWGTVAGAQVRALAGHAAAVNGIAYSPDGTFLASTSQDATVRLWDTETGTALNTLTAAYHTYGVAFSPDGTFLASTGHDNLIRIWE